MSVIGHERPRPDVDTRPAWKAKAACKNLDPDLFFPEEYQPVPAAAQAACASCPVRLACLEHALIHEPHGFWGGKSPRQRRRIRKQRGLRLVTERARP